MNTSGNTQKRGGFTVIELLTVMLVLSLLVAMSLSAYSTAINHARVSRCKVMIAKLDQLVMDRWESYRTRPLAVPVSARQAAGTNSRQHAINRLEVLREVMRMELPCSQIDVWNDPTVPTASPMSGKIRRTALNVRYNRQVPQSAGTWTRDWEAAECLYLIIASMRDNEKSALDFFTSDEIGDLDGDGVPEIHDPWGQPIQFILWAPGYREDAPEPALSPQRLDNPDSFDLLRVDTRWNDNDSNTDPPFDLKPLIFSFGPDKEVMDLQYSSGTPLHDPYRKVSGNYIGTILTPRNAADNITNHYQEAE